MKNSLFYRHLARFIRDESGVYAIIMALTGIFLLVAISFAFELSGMLMDKARLSDSLEQAALTLTAENNNFRTTAKLSGAGLNVRNKDIVNAYVAQYLPRHTDPEFTPQCDREGTEGVACLVTGKVQRHTWFPISVGGDDIVPERAKVGNYGMAVKTVEQAPSKFLDIMIAVNLDKSLNGPSATVEFKNPQCHNYLYERKKNKTNPGWYEKYCTLEKAKRIGDNYDLSNYARDQVFYGHGELEIAFHRFTRAIFAKEQVRSQTTRVSFLPFNYGAQVRTPNLEKRCLMPLKRRQNRAFLDAFEKRQREIPYLVFGAFVPKTAQATTRLYVRKLPDVRSIDYTEPLLKNALHSFWFGVTLLNGRNRNHFADLEYFLTIFPMYVDVDETIKYVKTMNPYHITEKDFPVSPLLDDFACFYGLNDDKDGDPSKNSHSTVENGDYFSRVDTVNSNSSVFRTSSKWYTAKDYRTFNVFVTSRLQLGPGFTNLASGLINATLQFLALGRNPEAKPEQSTQRVLFVVLTGHDVGNVTTFTHVKKEDAFCYPTPYRPYASFEHNKQSDLFTERCVDKTPAGIKPMREWLEKSPYALSNGNYRWYSNKYREMDKMDYEIVGKRKAGAEDGFDFTTGKSRYPDARSSALCLNIRQRLDSMDPDASEADNPDQPRAKIYFFIFGNQAPRIPYVRPGLATALLSCMPTQYPGTSDQEKYVIEVRDGNDLYEKMMSVLVTEEENEDGVNFEEVGFSRTPRR